MMWLTMQDLELRLLFAVHNRMNWQLKLKVLNATHNMMLYVKNLLMNLCMSPKNEGP